jgi:hypothetical protein
VPVAAPELAPEPLPPIDDHIHRDELLRKLAEAATHHRLVAVVGEPGRRQDFIGRVSLTR